MGEQSPVYLVYKPSYTHKVYSQQPPSPPHQHVTMHAASPITARAGNDSCPLSPIVPFNVRLNMLFDEFVDVLVGFRFRFSEGLEHRSELRRGLLRFADPVPMT